MSELKRTAFFEKHVALGAKIVEFCGWEMPIFYPTGIVSEHLATRKKAGLFDVSHMGRFIIRGQGALPFLQHVLTNNATALNIREIGAQYTINPNESGGAVDDAYLYRFVEDEYLLVVNAANLEKDYKHLQSYVKEFEDVKLTDRSDEIAMISLQGPHSREIMEKIVQSGQLPEPMRNAVSIVKIRGAEVKVSRTGYTGEPICFELFIHREEALKIWDAIIDQGAIPISLGARDTLRSWCRRAPHAPVPARARRAGGIPRRTPGSATDPPAPPTGDQDATRARTGSCRSGFAWSRCPRRSGT